MSAVESLSVRLRGMHRSDTRDVIDDFARGRVKQIVAAVIVTPISVHKFQPQGLVLDRVLLGKVIWVILA